MNPKTKPRFHALALCFVVFASSCAGCLGCKSPVDGAGSTLPSSCQNVSPLIEPPKLDVLFMIDNSSSMKEEQEGVARELTAFIDELKKGGGVSLDFHLGVITSSVYQHTNINGVNYQKSCGINGFYCEQSGKLQAVPDPGPDGGVILGTGTERILDGNDAKVVEKFSRLVQQGTNGSGQETPFEAIRLAVTDLNKVSDKLGGNAGFLRDGARLLVVILTDEDDCSEKLASGAKSVVTVGDSPSVDDCADQMNSLTPVSEYHRIFTEELKDSLGHSREVIWTAIAPVSTINKSAMATLDGPQVRNIDCPTSNAPGIRHRQMAEAFDPSLVNLDSICRTSYRETLLTIAQLASVSQTLDIKNVPDPRMLQIKITRKTGLVDTCTLQKGLTKYEVPSASAPGRVFFGTDCKRRSDDVKVDVNMLCIN
jgi:hypothetical protein